MPKTNDILDELKVFLNQSIELMNENFQQELLSNYDEVFTLGYIKAIEHALDKIEELEQEYE